MYCRRGNGYVTVVFGMTITLHIASVFGIVFLVSEPPGNGKLKMAERVEKISISGQVALVCALDAQIREERDLIERLHKIGQYDLAKPCEARLSEYSGLRDQISLCTVMTVTIPER